MQKNEMTVRFSALSQNEAFARVVVGAFASQLNPTMGEIADIKTSVSEAVTNAIIHAYRGRQAGMVEVSAAIEGNMLSVTVRDEGRGISDISLAREPFYTTCSGDDRSGMGFTVMETFMTELEVDSIPGKGSTVRMKKRIGAGFEEFEEQERQSKKIAAKGEEKVVEMDEHIQNREVRA